MYYAPWWFCCIRKKPTLRGTVVIKLGSWRGAWGVPPFSVWILFLSLEIIYQQEMQANLWHNVSTLTNVILSHFQRWHWANVSLPSLCVHLNFLKNESLIRKVLTLHWHSGNSSLHMPLHIKLYKWPTPASCSNDKLKAGTTSWCTLSGILQPVVQ